MTEIVKHVAAGIGHEEYKIWNRYQPGDVYEEIKAVWDGIFLMLTDSFCKKPSEKPVLYAIVLQNIMGTAISVSPADEI